MKTKQEILSGLANFFGTECYYRFNFGTKLTDGVKWLADNAECYWLLDVIASYQADPRVRNDESLRYMQFWSFKMNANGRGGVVTLERDQDDVVLTQNIRMTDFPLDEIKIWVESGVMLLPSEH